MACMLQQLRERGGSSKYASIFTDDLRCRHGVLCSTKTCRFHHRDAPAALAHSTYVSSLDALCRRASLGKGVKVPDPRNLLLVITDILMSCEATPHELRLELKSSVERCDCSGLIGLDDLKCILLREHVDVESLAKLQGLRALRLGLLQYRLQQIQWHHSQEKQVECGQHMGAWTVDAIMAPGSSYWMLYKPISEALELEQWKWSMRFHWGHELPLNPTRLTADEAWLIASPALAWGPRAWGCAFEELALRHVYPSSVELRNRLRDCSGDCLHDCLHDRRRSRQGSKCPDLRP